jgi:hypothetical protein
LTCVIQRGHEQQAVRALTHWRDERGNWVPRPPPPQIKDIFLLDDHSGYIYVEGGREADVWGLRVNEGSTLANTAVDKTGPVNIVNPHVNPRDAKRLSDADARHVREARAEDRNVLVRTMETPCWVRVSEGDYRGDLGVLYSRIGSRASKSFYVVVVPRLPHHATDVPIRGRYPARFFTGQNFGTVEPYEDLVTSLPITRFTFTPDPSRTDIPRVDSLLCGSYVHLNLSEHQLVPAKPKPTSLEKVEFGLRRLKESVFPGHLIGMVDAFDRFKAELDVPFSTLQDISVGNRIVVIPNARCGLQGLVGIVSSVIGDFAQVAWDDEVDQVQIPLEDLRICFRTGDVVGIPRDMDNVRRGYFQEGLVLTMEDPDILHVILDNDELVSVVLSSGVLDDDIFLTLSYSVKSISVSVARSILVLM